MDPADSTCWTVLRAAAAGGRDARDEFATRYAPLVRAYLAARWRGSALIQELDDALQDVFVECLRDGGALGRVEPDRAGGFRAFLYGVVRNVAQRVEQRIARRRERELGDESADAIAARELAQSRVFDRAWATWVMRQAAERQAAVAGAHGSRAQRRVELLRLRFHEELPIREIARLWSVDPAVLHHEYARARAEFHAALRDVISFYHPGSPDEVERECADLLALLAGSGGAKT
jgi:RNA polymerase sigma-70 factor (ECF subfamily)